MPRDVRQVSFSTFGLHRENYALDMNEDVGNTEPLCPKHLHVLLMSPHHPEHLCVLFRSPHCPKHSTFMSPSHHLIVLNRDRQKLKVKNIQLKDYLGAACTSTNTDFS